MMDDPARGTSPRVNIGSFGSWCAHTSRRSFLRLVAVGGTLALLPSFLMACDSESTTDVVDAIPGSGNPLLIDFSQGDPAVLQYALLLEQLEAEFYSRVVGAFGASNIVAAEQAILTEIRNHELAHRAFLAGTIGVTDAFTVTPTFRGVTFTDRSSVLDAARTLEDLGVAAYNGVAQYVTAPATLTAIAKIVSVEARHAATIRDLLEPRATTFAPTATDDVFRPTKVAATVQANLVDKLGFLNAPSPFVQGPNGGG